LRWKKAPSADRTSTVFNVHIRLRMSGDSDRSLGEAS
jgi:hypothetical protein